MWMPSGSRRHVNRSCVTGTEQTPPTRLKRTCVRKRNSPRHSVQHDDDNPFETMPDHRDTDQTEGNENHSLNRTGFICLSGDERIRRCVPHFARTFACKSTLSEASSTHHRSPGFLASTREFHRVTLRKRADTPHASMKPQLHKGDAHCNLHRRRDVSGTNRKMFQDRVVHEVLIPSCKQQRHAVTNNNHRTCRTRDFPITHYCRSLFWTCLVNVSSTSSLAC